ncbi:MAG: glycosyltransferase family A protein [Polyangiales bacterium]
MSGSSVGVVLIGRNEGERLVRALESVSDGSRPLVYVDSGSTDGSCERAAERSAAVVALDMSLPFTAARARNAGFERLMEEHPETRYVQFVDGDCEVDSKWIETAATELDNDPEVGAICGYLKERHPEHSIYNKICDVEWHLGPVGPTTNFGGNVMIRVDALEKVGGWNPAVIAAEDDELAVRLRKQGWKLIRLDYESMIHDVDMHHAWQWWRRAKRAGYAYAQVSGLHGATTPERKFVHEKRRALLWGLAVPAGALLMAPVTLGISCLALTRYPAVGARIALQTRRRGFPWGHSLAWGASCALSSFPEAAGVAKFYLDALQDRTPEIIEHKRTE